MTADFTNGLICLICCSYANSGKFDEQASLTLYLKTPKCNTTTYGLTSSRMLDPKLWNSLTHEIRNSCNLKTFRNAIRNHVF